MKAKEIIHVKIAGFIIRIVFVLSKETLEFEKNYINTIKDYYKNFLINQVSPKVDYTIQVVYQHSFRVVLSKGTEVYIHFYQEVSRKQIKTFYHLSGSQFQIIIRKITHELLVKSRGFILHASASSINNGAVLFLGRSGMGKSTTMKLLSSRFEPLGDDSVIVKKEKGNYYCYSSSAHEKNAWFLKNYEKHDIRAVCFINKSGMTKATSIINQQVVIKLLCKQLFSEKEDVSKQVKNLIYFAQEFKKFYYLDISINDSEKLAKLMTEL